MVIARFKQPVNMGENAHEIRLLALVVVPLLEKGTKSTIETGRTFATILSDADFRQRLLRAQSEVEFKGLMVVKAQRLARSKMLKNRHKYLLDAALHHSISSLALDDGQPHRCHSSVGHSEGAPAKWPMRPIGSKLVGGPNNNNNKLDADANNNTNNDSFLGHFGRNPRTSRLFELMAPAEGCQSAKAHWPDEARLGETGAKDASDNCCSSWLRAAYSNLEFGAGLRADLKRRLSFYASDFRDAFVGPPRTLQKTLATIWFLYFGILLPTIAFSSLNTSQTQGHMGDLRKAIIGQALGGLAFALLGGQPLVIIMTTAPLCLYTKGEPLAFLAIELVRRTSQWAPRRRLPERAAST